MIKEAFGVAETIDEAKEAAIAELSAGDDADISYEIIDMPKKKVLGIFGGNMAKVRAYVELPDTAQKKKANRPAKAEKTTKAVRKDSPKKNESAEKPVKAKSTPVYADTVDVDSLEADTPAAKAVAYLKNILKGFGLDDVVIRVALRDGGAKLLFEGEDLGVLIGHRGETLDALQYLASLAAGNAGGYYKITLDIGNYREKRERTLTSLAKRISSQVIRSGRSRSLEPMNPYERRIIHTAVQEIDGVVSSSVGEGQSRHIIISPEGGSRPANRKPSASKVSEPTREPKKDSDALPLYGKIK